MHLFYLSLQYLFLAQSDICYSLPLNTGLNYISLLLLFFVADKWLLCLRKLACLLLTVASFLSFRSFPYHTPSGPVLSLKMGVHFYKTPPPLYESNLQAMLPITCFSNLVLNLAMQGCPNGST